MYFKTLNNEMRSFYSEFQYEVGKEYHLDSGDQLVMCGNGFHYCDDLAKILYFSGPKFRLFEVEPIGKVIKDENKYCSEGIKIIREIPIQEAMEIDDYQKFALHWFHQYLGELKEEITYAALKDNGNGIKIGDNPSMMAKANEINRIQKEIIKHDKTGKNIFALATSIEGADIESLQRRVFELDRTGEYCYGFARCVDEANIEALQRTVINRDTTGEWCYNFALSITGANIELLQDGVIKADTTGKWCTEFAEDINGADIKRLQNQVIKLDKFGDLSCHFAKVVIGADIKRLQNRVIELDESGRNIYYFAKLVKGANIPLLREAMGNIHHGMYRSLFKRYIN